MDLLDFDNIRLVQRKNKLPYHEGSLFLVKWTVCEPSQQIEKNESQCCPEDRHGYTPQQQAPE